jgi:hypothetical protein
MKPSCRWSFGFGSWMVVAQYFHFAISLGHDYDRFLSPLSFSRARPMGELVEILPAVTSDSSLVTSLYSTSAFLELS